MVYRDSKWIIIQQWGMWMPMMPAILTVCKGVHNEKFRKVNEVRASAWLAEFSSDKLVFKMREEEWDRYCHDCYLKVKSNPAFQVKLVNKFVSKTPAFLKFCSKVYKTDLTKKSNKKLFEIYDKYVNDYEDLYVWGELFAFGSRNGLTDYLKSYLQKKVGKVNSNLDFLEIFNTLITPNRKSFIFQERENLLKLALKVSRGKVSDLDREIKKHTEKFQWVPYNYGSFIFDEKYFKKELNRILKMGNISKELKKNSEVYGNLPKRRNKIFETLKIDTYHRQLFKALAYNSFIIDYKKRVFTRSHFYVNYSLMKEISNRLKIDQRLAHCILRDELFEILVNGKNLDIELLKDRLNFSVAYLSNDEQVIVSGEKAKKYLEELGVPLDEEVARLREFKGQVASTGQIQGRVKVITGPKDFYKMRKGDIIVSHMTTPEYVPVLKQAVGIITDEGGITSHAAIVSRELKIPCVTGTKVATKILHDNNVVDLNASEGLIKVLYTSSPSFQ